MFRLLSKETNIFSIPIYMGVILAIILITNTLSFSLLNVISSFIAFCGMALGCVLFNKIGMTRRNHLPLFLYICFIFSFYTENLDIGISVALFTNSILLFFLTDENPKLRDNSYFLIGNILAVNFIFMPTTWTLFLFIIIHIIGNSEKKISLNIFRLILGIGMVFFGYFCLMYILGFDEFNWDYIPFISNQIISDFSALYALVPILFFCVLAILDHFINFNKKSPANKYKYAFILIFLLAQCLTLVFYMGHSYEYFLLVMLPISIILSRFLRFLNKPWMQEIGLWIIVLSCILFKFRFLLADFIL
ncbi:MAG: DUF6427 family protein [Flavobacteriaceae bacterium]